MRAWTVAAALTVAVAFCAAPAAAGTLTWNVDSGGAIADCPDDYSDPAVTHFYFTVSGAGTVSDVVIQVSIAHTWDSDLAAYLTSPGGTRVDLFNGVGGDYPDSRNDNFQDTRFDDSASVRINVNPEVTPAPFAGSYRPQTDDLSAFDGQTAAGVWTLTIEDAVPGETGTLFKAGQSAPWGTADGTKLILNIVPEPATLVLLGVGLAAVLRRARSRAN